MSGCILSTDHRPDSSGTMTGRMEPSLGVGSTIRTRDETTEVGQWRDLIVVRAEVAPHGVCTRRVGCPRRRR